MSGFAMLQIVPACSNPHHDKILNPQPVPALSTLPFTNAASFSESAVPFSDATEQRRFSQGV